MNATKEQIAAAIAAKVKELTIASTMTEELCDWLLSKTTDQIDKDILNIIKTWNKASTNFLIETLQLKRLTKGEIKNASNSR